jgi:dTDP-4-amino-4,6-dideoxygalactose transaminase
MIMDKVTATPEGCPYTCHYYTQRGGKAEYSPDMCPNTIDLLGRTIHLDIPPQMTDEDCDLTALAIRKVAKALL